MPDAVLPASPRNAYLVISNLGGHLALGPTSLPSFADQEEEGEGEKVVVKGKL